MNNTATTSGNVTSFAKWAFESSSVEGTSSVGTTTSDNQSQNNSRVSRHSTSKKRKVDRQPTIFELSNHQQERDCSLPIRKSMQTRQSKSESRYTSRNKKITTTTSGLVVGPDRTIFSIFESGKNADTRVGICVVNYSTAEMHVSEFIDTQVFIKTLNKIYVCQPTEILIPSHSFSGKVSKLSTIVKCNISDNVKICEAATKVYNPQEGLEVLEKFALLGTNKSPVPFAEQLIGKEFCLMAVSAASNYMTQIAEADLALKFSNFRVRIDNGDNTMLIDMKTVQSLELIENTLESNGMTLLKVIDKTVTKMGHRALRNDILQPLTDINSLKLRVSAVQELQNNPDFLNSFRMELKVLHDLDALFSKLLSFNHTVILPDQKLNYVILLKESIESATTLKRLFEESKFESKLLSEIMAIFSSDDISSIFDLINRYLNEDTRWASTPIDLQNQKAYAIKRGSNGLLDVLRQLYKSLTDDIMREVDSLRDKFGLNFSHGHDVNRQFYLKLKKKDINQLSDLDSCFINRVTKKTAYEFTTLNLMKMNTRLSELTCEMIALSEQTVSELLSNISSHIATLFMISEAISVLDLLCSLATTGLENNWILASFGNHLSLSGARHPILENTLTNFVANDVEAIPNLSSFQIVTGCNMSGKSIYLKQVAMLTILAQIGCPVPCTSASFPLYQKLHARVCNDDIEAYSSTFSAEMKDMAYFIDDITDKTLMILDELGRGSSIADGFSIALAISEYLLSKNATVFLSTHFRDIPKILAPKPRVLHLEMKTEIDQESHLKMKYKASTESEEIEGYGMMICKRIFSERIMLEAYKISELLRASKRKGLKIIAKEDSCDNACQTTQIKQVYYLVQKLKAFCNHEKTIDIEELRSLQDDFISTFEIV